MYQWENIFFKFSIGQLFLKMEHVPLVSKMLVELNGNEIKIFDEGFIQLSNHLAHER